MSLKLKVVCLISSIFIVYGLVGLTIQSTVILPSFREIERGESLNNAGRLLEALDREVSLLIPSATDWATWDDTYNYMADRNDAYFSSNLNAISLESLKVNYLGLYEVDGRKVWGLAYDLETGREFELGEFSSHALAPGHPLLDLPGAENTIAGLYPTPQGTLMVVSRPILPTSAPGASRGRVVIGRLLNAKALLRLSDQAKVKMQFSSAGLPARRAASPPMNTGYLTHSQVELFETPEELIGRSSLYGLDHREVLSLSVFTPRTITAQGKRTLNYAFLYLISSGFIVLLFLLLLLRRTLFAPVARFIEHVTRIGAQGDLSARIAMNRTDEIGILADQFDRMVELLAEARRKLLEQSYHSGMAEMASGVLHNIGNTVTPIGVKIARIRERLRQLPLAEARTAASELDDARTGQRRREDLIRFLQLVTNEFAAAADGTADELKAIQAQVDFINRILADQQRFSRAERLFESLSPGPLIAETARLLPEPLLQGIDLSIDPEMEAAGCVRGSRVSLQQVIGNLIINAAESIQAGRREPGEGRIRIGALQAPGDGDSRMMHLFFEDNGAGIAPENLPRLFERGFSTKARGSGMGLHWSANSVAALGGRIYAESPGPGRGATFHLLLPLAAAAEISSIPCQEAAA